MLFAHVDDMGYIVLGVDGESLAFAPEEARRLATVLIPAALSQLPPEPRLGMGDGPLRARDAL